MLPKGVHPHVMGSDEACAFQERVSVLVASAIYDRVNVLYLGTVLQGNKGAQDGEGALQVSHGGPDSAVVCMQLTAGAAPVIAPTLHSM